MATLEYVRAYIDDLLVITKGSLDDHLDKLNQVFIWLRDAGLKINATKSVFCVHALDRIANLKQTCEVKWNVPSQGNMW